MEFLSSKIAVRWLSCFNLHMKLFMVTLEIRSFQHSNCFLTDKTQWFAMHFRKNKFSYPCRVENPVFIAYFPLLRCHLKGAKDMQPGLNSRLDKCSTFLFVCVPRALMHSFVPFDVICYVTRSLLHFLHVIACGWCSNHVHIEPYSLDVAGHKIRCCGPRVEYL